MKQKSEEVWFIEKGSVGVYTRDDHLAFESMKKGFKTCRIKSNAHVFYFH